MDENSNNITSNNNNSINNVNETLLEKIPAFDEEINKKVMKEIRESAKLIVGKYILNNTFHAPEESSKKNSK